MQMYFIAVVLPSELDKKILKYKEWMHEKYGCRVGLKSPAHITIVAPFWTAPEKEETLRRDIDTVSATTPSFNILTNHFSALNQELYLLR